MIGVEKQGYRTIDDDQAHSQGWLNQSIDNIRKAEAELIKDQDNTGEDHE